MNELSHGSLDKIKTKLVVIKKTRNQAGKKVKIKKLVGALVKDNYTTL